MLSSTSSKGDRREGSTRERVRRGGVGLAACFLLLAASFARAGAAAPEPGSDARAILKAASDFIGGQRALELTFDSDIEVITPQLEKIQFTNSGSMTLVRPDKLRGHRVGGYADVDLFFDGKTAAVYGRNIKAYTQFEVPGSVDNLIEAMRAGRGVAMPFGDLILSRPYDVLVAGVIEAKHIGRGVVEGVECEHLAFRNADTDWQIWVEVGARPMPRKMVITSKTIAAAPQYTMRITTWKTDITPAADVFTFVPPAGAQQISPDGLIDLDELPQGMPSGGLK